MMRALDLFSAAAGGWTLGLHRAGFVTVAACEIVPWRRALYAENNPHVLLYDDVRTLTAGRLVSDLGFLPDIIVGSPPCQDISVANPKGRGIDGERSGLYLEAIRLVGDCRPRWFAFENSAHLRTRGADRVLDALAALGYACEPCVVGAGDIGANHLRKRSWLIGYDPVQLGDAAPDGCRQGWAGRCAEPASGARQSPCGVAADAGRGRQRQQPGRGAGTHRSTPPIDQTDDPNLHDGTGDAAHADEARQSDGCVVPGLRPAQVPHDGRGDEWRDDGADADRDRQSDGPEQGEMGGREGAGGAPAEPWSDWNGGLAGHLRVDDGLSAWVAGTRIALGGRRGTAAASLIVEAFGDAVLPQIPEAIGRAIMRTEAALDVVMARSFPCNSGDKL